MDEVIAKNIRYHREHVSWTQEQLAAAANLSVRTVQRAEQGLGMSAETLQAVAGAFDVSLDGLRTDPMEFLAGLLGVKPEEITPELLQQRIDEHEEKYHTIWLAPVTSSSDLRALRGKTGIVFECIPDEDAIQDLAAEFKHWLTDLLDMDGELSPTDERNCFKSTFEIVGKLNSLGCTVLLGEHEHQVRLESGDHMPFRTLYVVVTPNHDVKKLMMVPKDIRFNLEF